MREPKGRGPIFKIDLEQGTSQSVEGQTEGIQAERVSRSILTDSQRQREAKLQAHEDSFIAPADSTVQQSLSTFKKWQHKLKLV